MSEDSFNIDRLYDEVVLLSKTYPDAVYRNEEFDGSCYYTMGAVDNGPEGRVGCIMGQALVNIGVDLDNLLNGPEDGEWIGDILEYRLGVDTSDTDNATAVRFLSEVQREQDAGVPWGRAVEKAYYNE